MAASKRHVFTSESVTEGHPDKVADQISDAVLDEILASDPNGRVACETLVTTGVAVVAGEITTETYVDIPAIVRGTLKSIGYTDSAYGHFGRPSVPADNGEGVTLFPWEACDRVEDLRSAAGA